MSDRTFLKLKDIVLLILAVLGLFGYLFKGVSLINTVEANTKDIKELKECQKKDNSLRTVLKIFLRKQGYEIKDDD